MTRLNHLSTLKIRPTEKIPFTYIGKAYEGVAGDTVATALYANGIRIFSRSLKYHRPRGLYSLDGESANTYMNVDGVPNVCAEKTLLKSGMAVQAQNVKGAPDTDIMSVIDKMDWAMPAGFYYRSMHKPAKIWPMALKQIRKAAGIGAVDPDFNLPGTYDEIYPSADVCVIGGGAAGMAAALAAAGKGLRVILLESRPCLGGMYDYRTSLLPRAKSLADALYQAQNVRVLTHCSVTGTYTNHLVTAYQVGGASDAFDERYVEIRAQSLVVATGCIERPLLFENNERPGVMQIGCAHRLAHTYGILPGKKAVFSIGHDLGLEAAADLFDHGLDIACVADIREDGQDPELESALLKRRIPLMKGWVATHAQGRKTVSRATLKLRQGTAAKTFSCDLLVASAGLTPVTGPLSMAHAKLAYDPKTGTFLPTALPPGMFAAGRMLALSDPNAIEASGKLAGLKAAGALGLNAQADMDTAEKDLARLPGPETGCKLTLGPVNGRKAYICFDEDAAVKNVKQAAGNGFDVPELVKRFAAVGTGPGQGGIPGHNLPQYMAQHLGDPNAVPQPTTVRAPLVPSYIATFAGSNHDMSKRTPMNDEQKAAGGVFRRIGVWRRARYFSQDLTCRQEIENVRTNVGLLDASTLGKFRIFGPDAPKALQRIYVGNMATVGTDKMKYSAMCNDDGCIVDDGVIVKTGENDYYFTTSTARAGATIEWFRYHTRHDGWDFHMVNLTDAYGVINMAGPNAGKVLEKIIAEDVSNDAFPYIGYREYTINDAIPVRVMRLGFVGELSYELHVQSSHMPALWELLMAAGKEFGIRNFGVEAQNVLRMEKGHLIIGSESEQRTTLHDVGLGFLWYRKKPEAKTVGAVALKNTEKQPDR
ncbi:MAG: (2Fe-2S)-binding protein, partial [Deltaproteobacteria bacterium]|nr:(2Fe-2S)-binding protein [Deltaproteobacteria bacterium]